MALIYRYFMLSPMFGKTVNDSGPPYCKGGAKGNLYQTLPNGYQQGRRNATPRMHDKKSSPESRKATREGCGYISARVFVGNLELFENDAKLKGRRGCIGRRRDGWS